MTAPPRPRAALDSNLDLWHRADAIRQEWLGHGLSTEPADRSAAETALTGIYARLRRPRPRFVWVESPVKAVPHIEGLPTLDDLYRWINGRPPAGPRPLASDLAALTSWLRSALDDGYLRPDPVPKKLKRKNGDPWPVLPPVEALALGIPVREVLRQGIRLALDKSLNAGLRAPVRAALGPVPVPWYGQQDAAWIAYYDVLRRLGLARYRRSDEDHFDDWATLARSGGWWWPGEDHCVVVDRPAAVSARQVVYRDGWRVDLPGR